MDYKANKELFVQLLRSTNRNGMDFLIEDLEKMGFFEAPASASHHLNVKGGLVEHSLNVYRAAEKVWCGLCELEEGLDKSVPLESVIIASLLHDVCKANIYVPTRRKVRGATGQMEFVDGYKTSYRAFPAGHGEKSVIMLLSSGLEITDPEILAIRWHMGAWGLNLTNPEETRNYDTAIKLYPLVAIIQAGDNIAANVIERTGEEPYEL